jgi:isoquinoline 1-oxidoreductase
VRFADGSDARQLGYGELLRGQQLQLTLAPPSRSEAQACQRLPAGGPGAARVDIPAKATGELSFVHDVRVPGMRHGRVIRPPHPGRDGGDFIGRCLVTVDRDSVAHLPGNVQVVTEGDFVGVVADREEQAIAAMRALRVQWKAVPPRQICPTWLRPSAPIPPSTAPWSIKARG